MNCSDAGERLSALIDGALPPSEEAAVRRHLDSCSACRERRAELTAVVDLVREIPAPRLPSDLRGDVVARLPRRRRASPLYWLVPLAAAACLLVLARLAVQEAKQPEKLVVATGDTDSGLVAGPEVARKAEQDQSGKNGARGYLSEDLPKAPRETEEELEETAAGDAAVAPAKPGDRPPGRREPQDPAVARKYAVRGAEPDGAAGVILAELSRRRTACEAEERSAPTGETVVQSGDGDVAGLLLDLTQDEIEFVTCLLEERPGVRVDRVNGYGRAGKKRVSKAREPGEKDAGDATPSDRLRVELRFR